MLRLHYLYISKHVCLLQDLRHLSATSLLHPKYLLQTTIQCYWIKTKICPADSQDRLPGTAEGKIFSISPSLGLANVLVSQSKIVSMILFCLKCSQCPNQTVLSYSTCLLSSVLDVISASMQTRHLTNFLSTFPASDQRFGEHLVENWMEELQATEKYT